VPNGARSDLCGGMPAMAFPTVMGCQSIFEEYRQLDNAARERKQGLGLGLSIVQRLGILLGHRVSVRSSPGKGSIFAIEVELQKAGKVQRPGSQARDGQAKDGDAGLAEAVLRTGTILVVEDDPELRELLVLILKDDGHYVMAASDGISALELMVRGAVQPDLILADHNLPNGMDGLQAGTKLRESFHRQIPVIILTGDISPETLRRVAHE
jgi:two-component system, chemotaxis family, CheB/CheR fusion protein